MFDWSVKPCVTAERESSVIFVQFGVDIGCDEECDDSGRLLRASRTFKQTDTIYSTASSGLAGREKADVSVGESERMY